MSRNKDKGKNDDGSPDKRETRGKKTVNLDYFTKGKEVDPIKFAKQRSEQREQIVRTWRKKKTAHFLSPDPHRNPGLREISPDNKSGRKLSMQDRIDHGLKALRDVKYSKKIEGFTMFPKDYSNRWYLLVDEVLSETISPRFEQILGSYEGVKKQK